MGTEMFVLGAVFLGMAGIAGYGYVDTRGRIAEVAGTETATTRSLTEGVAALEGTVVEATEPLTAPLSGEDAVLVEWEIEEEAADEDDTGETTSGMHAVDFALEDGHGQVRVRPANPSAVTLSSSKRTSVHQYADRAIDEELVADLERFDGGVRDDPTFHRESSAKLSHGATRLNRDRRYVQEVIRPGDEIYVLGTATRNGDGEWEIGRGEDGRFLLSDMGPEALADHYGGNQTLLFLVTVLLLGVSGWAFATGLGLL